MAKGGKPSGDSGNGGGSLALTGITPDSGLPEHIFRSREFEQMEMEWFCPPEDSMKWYAFWKEERMKWWESLGVNPDNLIFRGHRNLMPPVSPRKSRIFNWSWPAPPCSERILIQMAKAR